MDKYIKCKQINDKIEYKLIECERMSMEELAKLGDEGWILCYANESTKINQYMFYRKKR